ncbi:glycerate kinase [Roseivirga sp.]|uniref:glycerate kinase n=1 Tax=Roseivirga sp. TaxID=1964215 RepID=UPI003B51BB38
MNILISPDKFKNSLTAYQVCDAIERGLSRVMPDAKVTKLPLADGGEGTLDILEKELGADRIEVEVSDPLFRPVKAAYLLKGDKAYIEMASASGLPLLKNFERSASNTSTYGTGELIAHAVEHGAKTIDVMIGGSATNDGGCGMAEALGVRFYATNGNELKAIRGRDLAKIERIDQSALKKYKDIRFTILSDVQNSLTGPNGASHVFAKQKGATPQEIEMLDQGLSHLASIVNNGKEEHPGTGAAGGLGYGLISFLNARLCSGIEQVFHILDYDKVLKDVDLIITGEGKLDGQTLGGKVISGVVGKAKTYNIPIGIICGITENLAIVREHLAVDQILQVREKASGIQDSMQNAAQYVEELAAEMLQSFIK